MMNKTQSVENFVYLVGLHIYYKMIHGPYNISIDMSLIMDKNVRRFVQSWLQHRGVQFLCIRLPGKLNFVCWHLIFMGPQYVTCFMLLPSP